MPHIFRVCCSIITFWIAEKAACLLNWRLVIVTRELGKEKQQLLSQVNTWKKYIWRLKICLSFSPRCIMTYFSSNISSLNLVVNVSLHHGFNFLITNQMFFTCYCYSDFLVYEIPFYTCLYPLPTFQSGYLTFSCLYVWIS